MDLHCVTYTVDNQLPSSVEIVKNKDLGEYSIHVTRDFAPGDTIFENTILHVQDNDTIRMKVSEDHHINGYIDMDIRMHGVYRKALNYREFFYFDSFTNHSCDPNATHVYTSPTTYKMVARKHIKAGEEMTNDYTTFDHDNDSEQFECRCKAANCKRFI